MSVCGLTGDGAEDDIILGRVRGHLSLHLVHSGRVVLAHPAEHKRIGTAGATVDADGTSGTRERVSGGEGLGQEVGAYTLGNVVKR